MVSETQVAPAAAPPLWTRVFRVFVEPGRLGDDLKIHPVWALAMLLGAALVVLSSLLIPTEVWQEMMRRQFLASGQQVPEGAAAMSGNIFRIWAVVGGTIFWGIWLFFLTGLVTVLFAFVLGDEGGYKRYLAATCHAMLIAAVGGLLVVPLRIAQSDPQLTLSVGTFFGVEGGWLGRFLAGLDLFALWAYAVLGVMVARIDGRRSAGSAVTILLVLAVGLTAAFALIPFGG